MSARELVRAWKEEVFGDEATGGGLKNPAGLIELEESEMEEVGGATVCLCITTCPCLSLSASAFFGCNESLQTGTCGVFSVGCCEA